MQSFAYVVGMLGGIAMAIIVPLLLVYQCAFEKTGGMLFVMIISVVSIGCGFALCRHCVQAASGRYPDDESEKKPGSP